MNWSGLAARPTLIWEAARTAWEFRSRGGVLPSRSLVRWRIATAYGSPEANIKPEDLVRFLEWRQALRSYIRRTR